MYDADSYFSEERLTMNSCCAIIVVGLPRCDINNIDIIDTDILSIFPHCVNGEYKPTALVGLQYIIAESSTSVAFEWDGFEVNQLRHQFYTITGQDAKIWLSTKVL